MANRKTAVESGVGVRIYIEHGQFEVWVGPAGDLADDNIENAFIAGTGATRDTAVSDAVRDLQIIVDALQSPPGVVTEVTI